MIVAIYLLSRKTDFGELKDLILKSDWVWLIPALLFYNLSKIASAFRNNNLYRAIPIHLKETFNLKLYYIGMFYNIFLPGGIGGDGYKAYFLNKKYRIKLKTLISALFLDRFFGLAAIFVLMFILLLVNKPIMEQQGSMFQAALIALLILVLPVTWLVNHLFFKKFKPKFWASIAYSFVVQGLQLVCFYFLMLALKIKTGYLIYSALFYASAFVSALPFAPPGGFGFRELTFQGGGDFLGVDIQLAVALGVLFSLITAASSLIGGFLRVR